MKLNQFDFRKPVKILQVFKKICVYDKDHRSLDDRKDALPWQPVHSQSGHILNNELFLPGNVVSEIHHGRCDLITLEDYQLIDMLGSYQSKRSSNLRYPWQENNHVFSLQHANEFGIFKLRFNEELELFLNWEYFGIGEPARENFLITPVQKNEPVEIQINGRTDFSLTSRRARVFKEQFHIFHYVGDFKSCHVLKERSEPFLKTPPVPHKTINLLKTLY